MGKQAEQSTSQQSRPMVSAPSISLPKGGGAIHGMGEKFASNPVTGTGSMSVPIATSPGRSGFGPQLSLSYDSGAGNGSFGFGWSLSVPSITRKTDKGLPQYHDAVDSDVFVLSGAEDLVPMLVQNFQGRWERENLPERTVNGVTYRVDRYRPRIEGLFARIERWTNTGDATDVFWRLISKDNIAIWYGKTVESRIADPLDPSRIFSWLICQSHDDKGNVIAYGYKAEDSARIFEDGAGHSLAKAHEHSRTDISRSAQRYLKRIRYGNRSPYFPVLKSDSSWPEPPDPPWPNLTDGPIPDGSDTWLFEAVFDYGEHDPNAPKPLDAGIWPARQDPFSSYRSSFEVRTYRTCQRVLMFHHFPGEAGMERDCLVRSTDFTYSDEVDPADVRNPVYTFLRSVTHTGYRRNNGGYDRSSLPPVEFEYTDPIVQDTVEEVDPQSLENLPIGLDGTTYRWTDLHGEGMPGILSEQAGVWFYKRNWSPIPDLRPDGSEVVRAKFAPLETVALKPNVALSAGAEFMDLAGDGQPDVVVIDGPMPGLYEHDEYGEGWQSFRPFTSRLNRDFRDPNLKFVDLDGDGHADVLITEDDAFVWHASLTEAGFGPARRVVQALDEEKGPRLVFADGTQSIYLADMSGDGLTDLVRIRNGEVCYWPNLGYGRFGAKVTMDHAPWLDNPDQFDQKRIRLADIDGTGTNDIIYLHRDRIRIYFNQSGNSWSEPHYLRVFPRVDDLVSITPLDLLGNGTACLVWSSPLPGDAGRQMRYVDLMGGQKPHLLVGTVNNLGAETRVHYAPSTKFYLQDKLDGKPWITRLPFPVHVVERVETYDHISRNRFVTRYAYHHGYFDGEEREFRGFGMVEQWDTEEFAALTSEGTQPWETNLDPSSHVPPVLTRTWFHTGAYLDRDHISRQFEDEYYREPSLSDEAFRALLLPDTTLPPGLTPEEEREACRALKGMILRQEVYADDAAPESSEAIKLRAKTPYSVVEQDFAIRLLQPRAGNRHAVFFTHPREAITYHYERNHADPRIQHALTLEVDDYGNVLKEAAIGYGRRKQIRVVDGQGNVQIVPNPGFIGLDDADKAKQTTALVTYTESRFTKDAATNRDIIDRDDSYRTMLPSESVTFELTGYAASGPEIGPASDPAQVMRRYQASDFVQPDPDQPDPDDPTLPIRYVHIFTAPEVEYEDTAAGDKRRRRVEWLRTLYRRDDLSGLLPLGKLQPLALPGESYKLAFTPGLLNQVFLRPRVGQGPEPLLPDPTRVAVLGGTGADQGGYDDLDGNGHWWIPSGTSFYHPDEVAPSTELAEASAHFFLARRYRDPFGKDAFIDFDTHDLLMVETRDALDNRVTVEANDYRVLQPRLVSDPNRNQTEVAFDTLGMVVGTAVMGKPHPAAAEGDTLTGFVTDPPQSDIDGFFEAEHPHTKAQELLKGATTRIVYDLHRFQRTQQRNPEAPERWLPACAATLARETHVNAPLPPQGLKIQLSFSYSDGFGREIQKKIQAEPGPLVEGGPDVSPRWVGSGWTTFNNKGKPVRQYEPFFSKRQRADGALFSDHRFEFGVKVGVSPVLFYDPAERVVATLHPNHSFEKVVFDPWQQTTYDVNDTVLGDPRTDEDIEGYVREYFKTQPATWQTWHAQRIANQMGDAERDAAQKAAAHADTFTTAIFDTLGRPFLTLEHNGFRTDGTPEQYPTRVELDIEGQTLAVIDARNLRVMEYQKRTPRPDGSQQITIGYDLAGTQLYQKSMDAGERWMLGDVAGNPIRSWDNRGHAFETAYDELRRPINSAVIGADRQDPNRKILFQRITYGEAHPDAASNLRGQVYQQFDSAGVVASESYDFKGNPLRTTRQLAVDYKAIPDWSQHPAPALEAERFVASTRYDALSRPIQIIAPHSTAANPQRVNVTQPGYNEAGLLERVDVWLNQSAPPAALLDPDTATLHAVTNIDYDAKGRRVRIRYNEAGQPIITAYSYDLETFRLVRLVTTRPHHPEANKRTLQDLSYTYDPVGNISQIGDAAQDRVFHSNQCVLPGAAYRYDALYRLIVASGREHKGNGTQYDHDDRSHHVPTLPNDCHALRNYIERYRYDAVGNILQMVHHAGRDLEQPGQVLWNRRYQYALDSNRLLATSVPGDPANLPDYVTVPGYSGKYAYDLHGNMTAMPHLSVMQWDFRDQLHATAAQVVNNGTPENTYYVYDASGQRVRKVTETQTGARTKQRLYLGGFEMYREYRGGSVTLERESLHVMDDAQRVALIETQTIEEQSPIAQLQPLVRYQLGNRLDSVSLEMDGSAAVITYEEYTPYGSTAYCAGRSAREVSLKRYRYTGKERDEETGFTYHGARYYAPWLGRWTRTDPIGLGDGVNLYRYVRSNPVILSDPTGRSGDDGQPPDDRELQHIEQNFGHSVSAWSIFNREVWKSAAYAVGTVVVCSKAPMLCLGVALVADPHSAAENLAVAGAGEALAGKGGVGKPGETPVRAPGSPEPVSPGPRSAPPEPAAPAIRSEPVRMPATTSPAAAPAQPPAPKVVPGAPGGGAGETPSFPTAAPKPAPAERPTPPVAQAKPARPAGGAPRPDTHPGLRFHYTSAENPVQAFSEGVHAESSFTGEGNLSPKAATTRLGILQPRYVVVVRDTGQFRAAITTKPVPAKGVVGGATDYTSPNTVAPSNIEGIYEVGRNGPDWSRNLWTPPAPK